MKTKVFLCGLTALSLFAVTQPAWAASMAEELRDLVNTHPQVSAGRKNVSSAEEQVNKAFGGYLPRVDLKGDAGYEYVDNPTRRDTVGDPFGMGRDTASVVATQVLYDGGATASAYEAAKLQKDAVSSDSSATEQSVLLQGVAAYLNVLRQRELINLSRQNEENIKRQLNLENERVQRGSGIAVDVLQAKSRLQISKERRVTVEGALKDAVSTYEQVYGRKPDMASMRMPGVPLELLPPSLDDAIKIAVANNPALESAKKQSAVASEQRDAAEADYMPRVNLEAAADYEHNKNTVIGVRRDYSVLVTANWNVFNGFATRANTARAAYDYAASQDKQVYVHRKVEEQTKLAWQALETARQRVNLLQNAVNIASEVYTSRIKLREAGKETAINVLDAENEVFNARINLTAALFDANMATYQVLQAMGQLSLANASSGKGDILASPVAD